MNSPDSPACERQMTGFGSPMLSAEAFRRRFPALETVVHLAACSQAPLSEEVDGAVASYLDALRRGAVDWSGWIAAVEQARTRFAALIGAAPADIAILPNVTICAYQAASALSFDIRRTIVTCESEFPSVAQVWLGQRRRGAATRFAGGGSEVEDYAVAVDRRTALVSIPYASYRQGGLLPVAEVLALARERGALTFVDASQALGVAPVDVRALDCDFLACGAQKYLLGIPGIAFLYTRPAVHRVAVPSLSGWFGRADPFGFDPHDLSFAAGAARFETGTPAIASACAAGAALELLSRAAPDRITRHVTALVERTRQRLEVLDCPVVEPTRVGPQVAVRCADAVGLASWLSEHSIMVSPRADAVRLAFHYYNNESDVDRVCDALSDYASRPAKPPRS